MSFSRCLAFSFAAHVALVGGISVAFVQAARIDLEAAPFGFEVDLVPIGSGAAMVELDERGAHPQLARVESRRISEIKELPTTTPKHIPEHSPRRPILVKEPVLKKVNLTKQPSDQTRAISDSARASLNPNGLQVGVSHTTSGAALGISTGRGTKGGTGRKAVKTPKPPYPFGAKRAGFEGSVALNLLIAEDGKVKDAQIVKSSGRSDCDESAQRTILRHWQFEPARVLGQAVSWRERVVVKYELR